jgi:hypothetical protein
MTISADRPAAAFEDFVDEDGGITQDAAIAWLRAECGLPEGVVRKLLRDAWNSGSIQVRVILDDGSDDWEHIAEYGEDGAIGLDGRARPLAPLRRKRASKREQELLAEPNDALRPGYFIHDLRYNADDLWWHIERQLEKLEVPAPKRRSSASSRGGRPEAPIWVIGHKFIDDWLDEYGCPQRGDGEQARLKRQLEAYLAKRTEDPPSWSTIGKHLKERIAERRNQLKADKVENNLSA